MPEDEARQALAEASADSRVSRSRLKAAARDQVVADVMAAIATGVGLLRRGGRERARAFRDAISGSLGSPGQLLRPNGGTGRASAKSICGVGAGRIVAQHLLDDGSTRSKNERPVDRRQQPHAA